MRRLHRRPAHTVAFLLAAAVLLGACAQSRAKPAGSGQPPAGIAADAIRLQLAGFAGGPGFRLPEDLGGQGWVLNMWASWYGPCRQEMPGFQQVYLQARTGLASSAWTAATWSTRPGSSPPRPG